MDSSGSINDYGTDSSGNSGYSQIRRFVYDIIEHYYNDNSGSGQLAVGYYSDHADDTQFHIDLADYSSSYTSLSSEMDDMPFLGGRTNLQRAAESILHDINSNDALTLSNTAILVITDGQANEGNNGTYVFRTLQSEGANVFAVLVVPPNGFYWRERNSIQSVLTDNAVIANGYFDLATNANSTSSLDNSEWAANKLCGF